jgi:hypothetical protein
VRAIITLGAQVVVLRGHEFVVTRGNTWRQGREEQEGQCLGTRLVVVVRDKEEVGGRRKVSLRKRFCSGVARVSENGGMCGRCSSREE